MEMFNLVDSVVINKIARDKSWDYYNEIRSYSKYMLDGEARDIFNSGNACMELFRMFIAEARELYETKYQAMWEEMYNEYVKKYKAYMLEESDEDDGGFEEVEMPNIEDCDDYNTLYNPEVDAIDPDNDVVVNRNVVNRNVVNNIYNNDVRGFGLENILSI